MTDIIELKETVSLKEATKWLSKKLDTSVSIADLLDFSLNGKIKISVQLWHRALADVYDFVCDEKDIEKHPKKLFRDKETWDNLFNLIGTFGKNNNNDTAVSNFPSDPLDPYYFNGLVAQGKAYAPRTADNEPADKHIWVGDCILDLAPIGNGRIEIMSMHNNAKKYSDIELINIDVGFILVTPNEKIAYKIYYQYDDITIPAASIDDIDHADYVIRTSELKRFCTELLDDNKPLDTREKNTYLKIIKAFCLNNGIDISERGVKSRIELICDKAGLSISETTAKKLIKDLKEIDQ